MQKIIFTVLLTILYSVTTIPFLQLRAETFFFPLNARADTIEPNEQKHNPSDIRAFATRLCSRISSISPSEKSSPAEIIDKTILNYIKPDLSYSQLTEELRSEIRSFWNQNERYFFCKALDDKPNTEDGHILKRIIQLHLNIPLLNDLYLSRNKKVNPNPINFNHIDKLMRNGIMVNETVVDYIDYIITKKSGTNEFGEEEIFELEILRDEILIGHFKAKRASEILSVSKE
ncbi:hypothetical protein [Kordiimonas sp. SCSIO 12610]|uniref:hypothetical protein n=1 Tax=Kordiimonas sp. SCSIO 12610 TaxID=2829597 RepID=UPI00210E7DC1|nr:hypothetical protein [Kordiimonas sp. SCSIO 12610]UTW54391.1 hypothetical protein KFF44_11255 [Kordiimonas sp. SCSIO 12610]